VNRGVKEAVRVVNAKSGTEGKDSGASLAPPLAPAGRSGTFACPKIRCSPSSPTIVGVGEGAGLAS